MMHQMTRTWDRVLRCLCSIALAAMLLPAFAVPAQAGTIGAGKTFSVDNVTYLVTAGSYVVVSDVVDNDAVPSVLTLPPTVKYGDETHSETTYTLVGIYLDAFRDCTNLVDLRVPDLGDGYIYGVAFDGCTNLKVIHLLGNAHFANSGKTTTAKDFAGVTDLSLIWHQQSFDFFTQGTFIRANCTFPVGTKAYFAADFVQGSDTKTVFVAGVKTLNGIYTDVESLTTPGDLGDPSSVDVYCDAEKGSDSLCPVSEVPALKDGYSAWAVTEKANPSSVLAADAQIEAPVVATAVSATDLNYGSVKADALFATGQDPEPDVTVTAANGDVLEEGVDYTLSCSVSGDGKDILDGSDLKYGTYKAYALTATGMGKYSGTCSGELKVYNPSASWYRAWNSNEYGNSMAIASKATVIESKGKSDRGEGYTALDHRAEGASGSVNASARVLVNSSDYAACLVAESLAGLFDVTVITVPKTLPADGLPADVKVQLANARNGIALVLGSKEYISDEVKNAVSDCVSVASRIGGKSTDASQLAVEAYNFIRAVEDGTYSLDLPSTYSTYGSTAMVIPSDAENAAMFSAAAWAFSNNAAIFFCDADGRLSAETSEALSGVDPETSAPYFSKVVVPSGKSDAVETVQAALSGTDVIQWACSESNVYDASEALASEAVSNGSSYKTSVFAPTDAGWGNLAAAACVAGVHKGSLFVVDFASESTGFLSVVEKLRYDICYGVVAASYQQCEPGTYEQMMRLWDFGEAAGDANMRSSEITVLTPEIECTGKAVKPAIKVVDKNGKELAEGTDYTVSYFDNVAGQTVSAEKVVNPGSYSVVVTGTYKYISGGYGLPATITGYYAGNRSATFKVTGTAPSSEPAKAPAAARAPVPAKAAVKSLTCGKKKLTVKWKAVSGATKYQVSYRVKGTKKWKTASAKGAKLTVSKLKKGKAYQVRVRAGNGSGWGAWSAVKTSKKVK